MEAATEGIGDDSTRVSVRAPVSVPIADFLKILVRPENSILDGGGCSGNDGGDVADNGEANGSKSLILI